MGFKFFPELLAFFINFTLEGCLPDRNLIQEEIKRRLNSGNACYHSVQKLLSSRLLSKNEKLNMQNYNFACGSVRTLNMVSDIKGGTWTEGV
jgi:hypothetical protein